MKLNFTDSKNQNFEFRIYKDEVHVIHIKSNGAVWGFFINIKSIMENTYWPSWFNFDEAKEFIHKVLKLKAFW